MKRFADGLHSGLVRPSIGQALANDSSRQCLSAISILDPECGAVVIAKIKFDQIAMQSREIDLTFIALASGEIQQTLVAANEQGIDLAFITRQRFADSELEWNLE